MYCRYCGAEVAADALVCVRCGRKTKSSLTGFLKGSTGLRVQAEPKNPWAAALLGFFLGCFFLGPAGYIYLGQWNWFWLTLSVSLAAWVFFVVPLVMVSPLFLILLGIMYCPFPLVFAVHQYQMAKKLNQLRGEAETGN